MVNHPNRSRKLRYRVIYGNHQAAFSDSHEAQCFAQQMAESRNLLIEVRSASGIIGQYDCHGPTAEFRGRGDEVYPANAA